MRAQIAGDWIADLAGFSTDIVNEACVEWRRDAQDGRKRPVPVDIRSKCFRIKRDRAEMSKPIVQPISDADRIEYARAAAEQHQRYRDAAVWRQRFAEDHGFPDFAAVIDYGIQATGRRT